MKLHESSKSLGKEHRAVEGIKTITGAVNLFHEIEIDGWIYSYATNRKICHGSYFMYFQSSDYSNEGAQIIEEIKTLIKSAKDR